MILSCSFAKIEKHYVDRHSENKVDRGVSNREVQKPLLAFVNVLDGRNELIKADNKGIVTLLSRYNEIFCVPYRKNISNCPDNIEC